MGTLYNNGNGGQSMGNMAAGMAAAQEAWKKAQLEGNNEAGKVATENYYKAEELHKEKASKVTKDMLDRADKVGQEKANEEIKTQQTQIQAQQKKDVLPQKLPALENEKGQIAQNTISKSLLSEYGNNYFELITYDYGYNNNKNNGELRLAGVLKEIPSFSMTSNWVAGPAASVSDTVKGLMCSPLVEMTTTLGGRDRAWMNLDEGTDRTYNGTERPSFDLSFKLYTNEEIGSERLTTYKTWIKALSLYTMPSIDSKVNINAMANNTMNGIYGATSMITDALNAGKDVAFGANKTDKEMPDTTDQGLIDRLTDAVKQIANTAAEQIASRDDEWRVGRTANTKNFYGAKLWYLKVLPGIFKNPLIVLIRNWNVIYSKEINPISGEPIWVEFKITCEMDQVASAPVWMKYLTDSENNILPYDEYDS